jgi:hypothetical protein
MRKNQGYVLLKVLSRGVWRGVPIGIKYSRMLPALWLATPVTAIKLFYGWPPQGIEG